MGFHLEMKQEIKDFVEAKVILFLFSLDQSLNFLFYLLLFQLLRFLDFNRIEFALDACECILINFLDFVFGWSLF